MLRVYREQACDFVICGHRKEFALTGRFGVDDLPDMPATVALSASFVVDGILLSDIEDYGISWNKLIPRHLADGLYFADIYGNEDIPFTLPLALRSTRVCFIKEPLYHYTQRAGSIMHASWEKWLLNHLKMRFLCLDIIPEDDTKHRGIALKKLYWRILTGTANQTGSEYETDFQMLSKEIVKKTKMEFIRHPDIVAGEKIMFIFLGLNRWAIRLVAKHLCKHQ